MPTYGYRCSNCGHEFEIQQKITDQPLKACPKCQGKLAKILYPVGISFKGSGFYTTDYKGSGKSSDGSSSDGAANASGGSESKPESKSESKPESKPDKASASKSDSKTEKKAS
ncbi:MAG TPA: FmdB family zinc ribbon protein [Dehalococcoidia bacterium]|jgi:putative FmdB family regulatory protein|nr:FmdB family zinc ribbon protein [Dehalococcoidia bacterium]